MVRLDKAFISLYPSYVFTNTHFKIYFNLEVLTTGDHDPETCSLSKEKWFIVILNLMVYTYNNPTNKLLKLQKIYN